MTATGANDRGEMWFTVSRGHHAGQMLMRGSAGLYVDGGPYFVLAWMKSKKARVVVWTGSDPFTGSEVVEKINGFAASGVPQADGGITDDTAADE